MRASDGVKTTRVDYPSCENVELVKMDFLGLRNLGVIDHAIENIRENRGVTDLCPACDSGETPADDLLALLVVAEKAPLKLMTELGCHVVAWIESL
ncbi:DUF6300 family protein [Streptomyces sp. NPDC127113]|uniref:DUF6300 family protein n=1 Tax=Streptomyces sp. NPDC127113 TaxID=3345365 RepID=UPI00363F1130